jgi:hypothetical protein
MAKVAVVRCEDYTPSNVLKAVKKAVDLLGGMERFVCPGQRALIKPNLLSIHPLPGGLSRRGDPGARRVSSERAGFRDLGETEDHACHKA